MDNKKIVFVLNNFSIGGVELLLLDLLDSLVSSGYEVHIVSILGSGPLEVKFASMPLDIHHAELKNFSNKKFPLKLYWLVVFPITIFRTIRILRKIKPDIVVTSLYQSDVIGMTSAWFANVKKRIIIQHDVQKFGFLRRHFKKLFAFGFATDIVAVSNSAKDFLVSYFKLDTKKITVIENAIDMDKFTKASRPLVGDLVFGIVGRLEPVKGHICLLEALKIIKQRDGLEPKVVIVGGGSLRKSLEEYAIDNKLHSVIFTGETTDVPSALLQIDVLVFPSIEEGFGLVVIESLASGKAILASKIPAFEELIQNHKNGLLFEGSEELARLIKEFILDKKLVEKYQNGAQAWANSKGQNYDIKATARKYKELFWRENQFPQFANKRFSE